MLAMEPLSSAAPHLLANCHPLPIDFPADTLLNEPPIPIKHNLFTPQPPKQRHNPMPTPPRPPVCHKGLSIGKPICISYYDMDWSILVTQPSTHFGGLEIVLGWHSFTMHVWFCAYFFTRIASTKMFSLCVIAKWELFPSSIMLKLVHNVMLIRVFIK